MDNKWNIYEIRNRVTLNSIEKKLNIMIIHYAANPSRSENHIIELRDALLNIIKNY